MQSNSQRVPASDDEDAYQSSLRDAIRADISRRLKRICSNFSDEDFATLVDGMADTKIRGDRRTSL